MFIWWSCPKQYIVFPCVNFIYSDIVSEEHNVFKLYSIAQTLIEYSSLYAVPLTKVKTTDIRKHKVY